MRNPIPLIHQLCKERGVTVTKMEKDLGFFKGYLNSKRTAPIPEARLMAIAHYLQVSPDIFKSEPSQNVSPQSFNQILFIRGLCKQKGVPISQLEKDLKFSNGYLNAKRTKTLPTERVLKIAKYLNVSPEYLMTGEEQKPKREDAVISIDAHKIAKQYDGLDDYGKALVKDVVNHETRRVQALSAPAVPDGKVIPFFANSFAAGTGEPDFGNMWTNYTVPADSGADFAIRVNGDSMEPLLPDGSIALGVKREPRDGEIGAFLLNGEFLVKQYCCDYGGNVYLFSLNRERKDADRELRRGQPWELYCFGTIMVKRQPLPEDY